MQFGELEIDGYSLGGIETAVWLPRLRLAIDVGRGPQMLVKADRIALTHCHMDHAGGLAYLLALRQLYGMKGPTIYVPAQSAEKLQDVLDAWDRLQRFDSNYVLVPVHAGERYPVSRDIELRPFRTYHVVPSVGYEVIRTSNKLKPEFHGVQGSELGRLKREGIEITDRVDRSIFAVTGDTLTEVLDKQPHILEAETLVCECTFLDDRKPYENARAGGHIHLTDLQARAGAFKTSDSSSAISARSTAAKKRHRCSLPSVNPSYRSFTRSRPHQVRTGSGRDTLRCMRPESDLGARVECVQSRLLARKEVAKADTCGSVGHRHDLHEGANLKPLQRHVDPGVVHLS